jgi:hypothetical protein
MKDSCGAWKFLSNCDKKSILPKCRIASYNTQEAIYYQVPRISRKTVFCVSWKVAIDADNTQKATYRVEIFNVGPLISGG